MKLIICNTDLLSTGSSQLKVATGVALVSSGTDFCTRLLT